jgi:hypothetical protein
MGATKWAFTGSLVPARYSRVLTLTDPPAIVFLFLLMKLPTALFAIHKDM